MTNLFYRELGEENDQALVILHGVFGSSDNWLTLGKRFAEHYHVFLVDQRNHGQSPHTDEFTYQAMADDLRDFIQDKGIESAYVIGHSMGGKVSMLFALQNPELLEKLMVVDIAPRAYPVHHHRILEGLQAIDLAEIKSRGQADKALAVYEPLLGVRQFLLKNLYRKDKNTFAWRINLPVIARDIEKISIAIEGEVFTKPTCFVRGLKSHYISDEDKSEIQRLFPHSSLVDFEKAGHWVHAEQPDEFYDEVIAFFGN